MIKIFAAPNIFSPSQNFFHAKGMTELRELKTSGLPIFMDEGTGRLSFGEGVSAEGSSDRLAGEMSGLWMDERGLDEKEYCYTAYRGIARERDRAAFAKFGFRYDITVIAGGTVGGERKKTSGHYHGLIEGKIYSYPEVYEVLSGTAVYILQKSPDPENTDGAPIDELLAVTVLPGQAIIIPPMYGHCSINAGDGPLAFSNIAVTKCPLNYEAVKRKRGMAAYLTERGGERRYEKNPLYGDAPEIKKISPAEDESLGVKFGRPVYAEFIGDPDKFDFLLNPEKYLDQMLNMLKGR
jgi:glucose-6-phosphate isomerase